MPIGMGGGSLDCQRIDSGRYGVSAPVGHAGPETEKPSVGGLCGYVVDFRHVAVMHVSVLPSVNSQRLLPGPTPWPAQGPSHEARSLGRRAVVM
jgi:hypothetical protein